MIPSRHRRSDRVAWAWREARECRQVCRVVALLAAALAPALPRTAAAAAAGAIAEEHFAPRSGPAGPTLFTELPPERTGIVTENRYADPAMWNEHYAEFAVGAVGCGVAIGDYDADGRPDVFVVSKTESCRLFRNLGGWQFEDVTERAGVADSGEAALVWKQGTAFVDVDNDGRLDLYVCRFNAPNRLYHNQGDGTFREEAAQRGLALADASVMGAFCDYDRDGALDVFVQTNLAESIGHRREQKNHLFHNRGDGVFTEVSEPAGISGKAQGHSAIWWDYDEDGWPDLYVANDFTPPDQLYHNQRDGTFRNVIDEVVPHMPFSSMGSDLGDVNNDGHLDLLVADMAATTHQKDQRTMANARQLIVDPPGDATAAPFVMRNALYLNTGLGRMLEAACLAGIAATDWTWSPRFEDLDNDGWLDLHVTNGMYREPHNADLMARIAAADRITAKITLERMSPVLAEENLAFRNRGDLQFEPVGTAWGLDQKGVSFGSAFGDLDGDGDLDLVFVNYQKGVTVLRNDAAAEHAVIFALRGTRSNRFGVGATVRIHTAAGGQTRQLVLARGVVSTSEPVLHFGLGESARVDRVEVEWPSGQVQVFEGLPADRKYTLTEPDAADDLRQPAAAGETPLFTEVSAAMNLRVRVRASAIGAGAESPLVPVRQNRRGPPLAVGDLRGRGADDLVVGGTPRDPARRWFAPTAAGCVPAELEDVTDSVLEDGPLLIFDADGDGDNDLLVTRSGVARPAEAAEYQPKLLLNDGAGVFHPAPDEALPRMPWSMGAVAAVDFDRDGRLDLFAGGRVQPGRYPQPPRSALLRNLGGHFEDATQRVAPDLVAPGMVTSALWSDVDDDGWLDLLIAVEWGGVRYFHNAAGARLEDWTERAGFARAGNGWWTALAAADFNGDGRPDFAAGNVGLNTPYQADAVHPVLLLVGDFGGSGRSEVIEAYYEADRLYPRRTRRDLGTILPELLQRFPRNDHYARASLPEILGATRLGAAQRFAATELRSGAFLSQADGTYRFAPLPRIAQIAPIQGLVAGDFDGDGAADLYAVQNSFAPIPSVGRYDGGLSQLLCGDGTGGFHAVPPAESGLVVTGDAKALGVWDLAEDGHPDFVVTRNNDSLRVFRQNPRPGRHGLAVRLRGRPGNPTAVGARVTLELAGGKAQVGEVGAGSGYCSQSSPACFFGWTDSARPAALRVRWPDGAVTVHRLRGDEQRLAVEEPGGAAR